MRVVVDWRQVRSFLSDLYTDPPIGIVALLVGLSLLSWAWGLPHWFAAIPLIALVACPIIGTVVVMTDDFLKAARLAGKPPELDE